MEKFRNERKKGKSTTRGESKDSETERHSRPSATVRVFHQEKCQ